MILVIDVGNTNIVVGCIDDEKTYFVERLATVRTKTELEYAIDLKNVLDIYKIHRRDIEGGIVCSVVPQITSIINLAAEKILRKKILVVGPGVKTGLNILMDNPAQLGSDLVAAAVAGIAEYPVPLILIDMGTATTVCVVDGKKNYIGGGEESYGFLCEDFVRDKDAVSACSLLAEICAWAKDQGKTLYDVLMDIYVEYGFSKETTVNVVKPGKSGADEIKAMMDNFRANPPKEIGSSPVKLIKDYKTLKMIDAQGNAVDLDMPETSNVLQYFTEDGTKISVRPSGTEPKIKFYIEVKGEMGCPKCYASADAEAEEKVVAVRKSLGI